MIKIKNNLKSAVCLAAILILTATAFAQKRATAPANTPTIIFAVTDAGKTAEPVAAIENGELKDVSGSAGSAEEAASFAKNYYQSKTVYDLIFGAAANGTVTIKSSNPKAECAKNLADVTTISSKAKMSQWVMGLAVSPKTLKNGSGVRRIPTTAERAEIETLVRAEFIKQKVSARAAKTLKYYNLTALDTDNDGKAEMVGSYYADSSAKEKNMLFFIAEKGADGKYEFGYSEYAKVTPKDIMSGDLKDIDTLGGELLIDALDYNGDGTAEIFTISRAFEGNNFHVYNYKDGKWTRVYEGYNYHCAY